MATEYKLSYTASEINEKLGKIDTFSTELENKANVSDIPTALKNPFALTIKVGSTAITYDGSAAKTIEIADGSEVSY